MYSKKNWVFRPEIEKSRAATFAAELGIEVPLATLLLLRGIETVEAAHRFFAPSLQHFHDPFLMKDMDVAVERILKAIATDEKVMIYGDYDVDGTTSTALLVNFLSEYLSTVKFYIPDRYIDGYGISQRGIDYAADSGVTLVITVDCGIKASEEVAYAKSRGVDFIVSDHHLPEDHLPEAVAVLDPKRVDCSYPFEELSGCGVAFKIVQAIAIKKGLSIENIAYLLDLVVVSIAADIVPLIDENRVLAHFGLIQLNSPYANRGLSAIIDISGLRRGSITIEDIIFKIGPRINATGRMEIAIDPDDLRAQSGGRNAVKLMTAINEDRAKKYVEIIEEFNSKRKNEDRIVTDEAFRIIESDPQLAQRSCTIIYKPEWMKGVMGIVASRLIEGYYRPTVVLTQSNGMITGSARSVPGFDLYAAVESCADLLQNFGGHTYAVGLTMHPDNYEEFCARFEKFVVENINKARLEQKIKVDMELQISHITPNFRRALERLAPFGPGNPSPVFVSRGVRDNGSARKVGIGGEHLRLTLYEEGQQLKSIEAIGFSMSEFFPHVASGGSVDICYTISENHYGRRITPQLKLKDIEVIDFK